MNKARKVYICVYICLSLYICLQQFRSANIPDSIHVLNQMSFRFELFERPIELQKNVPSEGWRIMLMHSLDISEISDLYLNVRGEL